MKSLTQKSNAQIGIMNLFPMMKLLYVALAKQCPLLPILIPQYQLNLSVT